MPVAVIQPTLLAIEDFRLRISPFHLRTMIFDRDDIDGYRLVHLNCWESLDEVEVEVTSEVLVVCPYPEHSSGLFSTH